MSKQPGTQLNYKLGKTLFESGPISSTYNIQNSITQEIWKAKVFDLTKIEQYDMLSTLEYNEQVFSFLKDKYENSLYLEKTFQKDHQQFLVFQFWKQRLSDYISKHSDGIQDQLQVKRILQDILMSICDIYAENYMIFNLRPQNIVKVQQPSENTLGWKIQSLVFQYETHGLPQQSEYEFDYTWASNEQKNQQSNLDDTLKDQQIVWYMGILTLRLIYGPKFKLNQKFKDSDLNLTEIKKKCLPEVFELIQKSVKANLKDRIPLKKFLSLDVFSKVEISSEIKDKFISGNSDRIKKSSIMKGSILQKSINRKNTEMFQMTVSSRIQLPLASVAVKNSIKTFTLSQEQVNKIYNELKWNLQKCLYLAQIKDYTQTSASLSETSAQDKTLIRFLYFKLAQINLQRFKETLDKGQNLKSFRQSLNSQGLYKNLLKEMEENAKLKEDKSIVDKSEEYENKLKKLDPNHLKILSNFKQIASNLKKSIEAKKIKTDELVDYFELVLF